MCVWDETLRAEKAQLRLAIDMDGLLKHYCLNDQAQYQTLTALSADKINDLHGLIAQFINGELKKQHIQRIQACINNIKKSQKPEEHKSLFFQLGKTLFAQNHIDVIEDTITTFFQYKANIFLTRQQKDVLERLLPQTTHGHHQDRVEKIIMGGGKSKVLLPLLAKRKTNGLNLVMIEVPQALLRTNYVDLNETSQRIFDHTAKRRDYRGTCPGRKKKNFYRTGNNFDVRDHRAGSRDRTTHEK